MCCVVCSVRQRFPCVLAQWLTPVLPVVTNKIVLKELKRIIEDSEILK